MHDIKRKQLLRKKAFLGITTSILFMAVITLSAIAALGFLASFHTFKSKAHLTTQEIANEVTAGPSIVRVDVEDGRTGYLNNFSFIMRASPGYPDPIDLQSMSIEILMKNNTQSFIYGENKSTTRYTYEYTCNGTEHLDGFLVSGDLVQITFDIDPPFFHGRKGRMVVRPDVGAKGEAAFITPQVITRRRIQLFP